jgi:hypothetical protein
MNMQRKKIIISFFLFFVYCTETNGRTKEKLFLMWRSDELCFISDKEKKKDKI